MKKQLLSFALAAAIVGSMAAGCSSEKKAGSSADSAKMADSAAKMSAPAKMDTTMKTDTAKHDTTKTPPMK